jgi:hypothetical protein
MERHVGLLIVLSVLMSGCSQVSFTPQPMASGAATSSVASDPGVPTSVTNPPVDTPVTPPVLKPTTFGWAQAAVGDDGYNPPRGNVLTLNFEHPTVTGNIIILSLGWGDQSVSVGSVSDTQGNAYVTAIGPTNWCPHNQYREQLLYAPNIRGGINSITVTLTGNPKIWFEVRAYEYNGIIPNSPLDVTAVGVGSSTTADYALSTGSAITNYSNELVFEFGQTANVDYATLPQPGLGFALVTNAADGGYFAGEAAQSTPGSVQADGTRSSTIGDDWMLYLATFRTQ